MKILLKTLTEKSIIEFGKNKDMSVADILIVRKIDLIYTYFNYSNLTFTNDILDKLKIDIDDRITKPGKNPDIFQKYLDRNISKMIKFKSSQWHVNASKSEEVYNNRKFKAKLTGIKARERIYFSKNSLRWRNQGH